MRGYVNRKKGKLNIFIFIQHSTKTKKCYHGWEILSYTCRAGRSLDWMQLGFPIFKNKYSTEDKTRRKTAVSSELRLFRGTKKTIGIFFFCNKNEDNFVRETKIIIILFREVYFERKFDRFFTFSSKLAINCLSAKQSWALPMEVLIRRLINIGLNFCSDSKYLTVCDA